MNFGVIRGKNHQRNVQQDANRFSDIVFRDPFFSYSRVAFNYEPVEIRYIKEM